MVASSTHTWLCTWWTCAPRQASEGSRQAFRPHRREGGRHYQRNRRPGTSEAALAALVHQLVVWSAISKPEAEGSRSAGGQIQDHIVQYVHRRSARICQSPASGKGSATSLASWCVVCGMSRIPMPARPASCRSHRGAVSASSHAASQRCSNRSLSGTGWSPSCFLFLFLRSLDWRRDQGGSGSTGPSVNAVKPPKSGGAWNLCLNRTRRPAARNRPGMGSRLLGTRR